MKASKPMPNVVSALTARTQLGQIMKRASEKNERFVVDRRGEPAVIIMSIKDYIDTIAPAPDWLKKSWEDARRKGLHKLTMREINAEIAASRKGQDKKARKSK
jgi:prevent-host-death family protein